MTQLPTGQTPNVAVSSSAINPSLLGGPTLLTDIGSAAEKIGSALEKIDERKEELNRQRTAATGQSELLVTVAEAKAAANDADPADAEAVYDGFAERFNTDVLAGVQDDRVRDALEVEASTRFRLGAVQVKADSANRMRASTADQLRASIDQMIASAAAGTRPAEQQINSAAMDEALTQLQPLVSAQDFVKIQGEVQAKIEGVEADRLNGAIDLFKSAFSQTELDVGATRQETFDRITEEVKNSGLPLADRSDLMANLLSAQRESGSRVRENIEARSSDAFAVADQRAVEELEALREEAQDLPGNDRIRAEADIDSKIKRLLDGAIDSADKLDLQIQSGTVNAEASQSAADLDANYTRRLERGMTPAQALSDMLLSGTRLPDAAIKDIRAQMTGLGGVKSRGVDMLVAIHDAGRPLVAEKVALDLGGEEGDQSGARAALQGALNARESGQPLIEVSEVVDDPRFADNVATARLSIPFTVDEANETEGPPSPFPGPGVVANGTTLKAWLKDNTGLPEGVNADIERRFVDTYSYHYADFIQKNRVSIDDQIGQKNAADSARDIALKSINKRFTKAPTRSSAGGVVGTALGVLGVGQDTEDVMIRSELVGDKEKEYRLAVFDALNVTFNASVPGGNLSEGVPRESRVVEVNRVRENTMVDSTNAFDDNGTTVAPIVRVNDSGAPVETIGFLTFNKGTGSRTVVLSESQRPPKASEREVPLIQFSPFRIDIAPVVRALGGSEELDAMVDEIDAELNPPGTTDKEEVFDDARFAELQGRFKRRVPAESINSRKGVMSAMENTTGNPNLTVADSGDRDVAVAIMARAQFIHLKNSGRPPNDSLTEDDRGPLRQIANSLAIDLGWAGLEKKIEPATNTTE